MDMVKQSKSSHDQICIKMINHEKKTYEWLKFNHLQTSIDLNYSFWICMNFAPGSIFTAGKWPRD